MTKTLLALVVACVLLAGGAQALTIYSLEGTVVASNLEVGDTFDEMLATGWHQSVFTSSTAITVLGLTNAGLDPAAGSVHFDLLRNAPNGTLVTSADITLGSDVNYGVFSGLFLAPGDYYIVASVLGAADSGAAAIWRGLDLSDTNTFQQTGTQLQEYLKTNDGPGFLSSTMNLGLQVTGNLAAVPEPATLAFVGVGLLALGLLRRKLV